MKVADGSYWHKADIPSQASDVRFRGKSGRPLPLMSADDPKRTSAGFFTG